MLRHAVIVTSCIFQTVNDHATKTNLSKVYRPYVQILQYKEAFLLQFLRYSSLTCTCILALYCCIGVSTETCENTFNCLTRLTRRKLYSKLGNRAAGRDISG